MSIESNNCPELEPCGALAGGETVLDERMECFSRETTFWWSVAEGYADHHFYTFGTDAAADDTIGRFTFDVEVAGRYRVEVFIPSTQADSQNASYDLDPGSGAVTLGPVDQSVQKGWVTLGELQFEQGAGRTLALGDATGESPDLDRKLAYDAVRFTFVPPEPGEGGGGAGPGSGGGSAGAGGDGAAAQGGEAAGGGEAQGGDGATDGGADAADGCSCQLPGRAPSGDGRALLALAVALALSSARRPWRARS